MKITIVKCDRCKNRINEEDPIHNVKVSLAGDTKKGRTLELCSPCEEGLKLYLTGSNVSKPGRTAKSESDLYRQQLEAARRTANKALERFADGATADQLRSALQDVVSAAHRPANGSG